MTAEPGIQSCPIRRIAVLVVASLFVLFSIAALPIAARAQETLPSTVHVVRAGETLTEIADTYGVTAEEILQLNGIENADTIIVGQRLRIPLKELDAAAPAPPGTHRVQPGETLSEIAKRYAVELAALMELNGLDDPNAVFSGQLLALPPDADFEAASLEVTEAVETALDRATATVMRYTRSTHCRLFTLCRLVRH